MSRAIARTVTCHAWSPDRKRIALCPNSEDVLIYTNVEDPDVSKWKLEHTLKGHDLVVSAIDWSPVHNKIVTCSHDRNAFVWTLTAANEWKPSLSILRINRAATCVRWSPDGKKFAVASGANVVPVCFYEEANDWWISKMIKRHRSTVLWVAWHPNSQLLATASSDFRCRVFSGFIDKVDTPLESILCANTGDTSFGDLLAEYDGSNGWVEGCAWSPDGFTLSYVGHDGSVTFNAWDPKKPTAGESKNLTLRENFAPSCVVMFLSPTVCVTAGHDMKPHVYQSSGPGGAWAYVGSTDKEPPKAAPGAKKAEPVDARQMWANKTVKGQSDSAGDSVTLWTKHANTITDIKPYGDTQWSKALDAFSTSGLDGQIHVWKAADFKAHLSVSL